MLLFKCSNTCVTLGRGEAAIDNAKLFRETAVNIIITQNTWIKYEICAGNDDITVPYFPNPKYGDQIELLLPILKKIVPRTRHSFRDDDYLKTIITDHLGGYNVLQNCSQNDRCHESDLLPIMKEIQDTLHTRNYSENHHDHPSSTAVEFTTSSERMIDDTNSAYFPLQEPS